MAVTKADVINRVGVRMDTLEWLMKNNYHMKDVIFMETVFQAVLQYWSQMNEEDREFYEAARWATDNQKPWNANVSS
jgi:hypothetical protein